MKGWSLEDFDPDNVAVWANDLAVVRIGLVFTVYFRHASTAAKREAVMGVVRDYAGMTGQHLRWMVDPQTKNWSTFGSDSLSQIDAYLRALETNDEWSLRLQGGASHKEASLFGVVALGPADWDPEGIGVIQLRFPTTWFADFPTRPKDVFVQVAGALGADQGYGALGLIESGSNTVEVEHQPDVYALATRFPGLEVDDPISHSIYLSAGTKPGTWLTALADHWVDRLGGVERLRSEIASSPTLTATPYAGGIIIQAGAAPQFGDSQQFAIPAAYRAVAKLLKPIRVKQHRKFHESGPGKRFTPEATMAWFSRLD